MMALASIQKSAHNSVVISALAGTNVYSSVLIFTSKFRKQLEVVRDRRYGFIVIH